MSEPPNLWEGADRAKRSRAIRYVASLAEA